MSGVIEVEVDLERDITIITVTGAVTRDQVSKTIQDYYESHATKHVLWDFSAGDFKNISGTDPQQLAGVSQQFMALSRQGGKTALVFASDIGFGLGRMFETFRSLQDSDVTYGTFRSREKAMEWLDTDLGG